MGDTLCPTCPAAEMTFAVRERFFTPRLRFKTLDELNAWLLDKCIAYAKAHHHPELNEQTVWGGSSFPMLAVSTDSMRCRFEPIGNTPEEFATQIKIELEKWVKVIRAANIKAQ
jgi:hypothetical protein